MDDYEALQSPIAGEENALIFLQQKFCAEEFVLSQSCYIVCRRKKAPTP
jgi:hypothetical protein